MSLLRRVSNNPRINPMHRNPRPAIRNPLQCEKVHATADLRALFMPRARGSQDDQRYFASDISVS
jgi:hypothetical protein